MSKPYSRAPRLACIAALLLSAIPALAQEVQTTAPPVPGQMPGAPVRVIPADAPLARMELAPPSATEPMRARLDGKTVGVAPGLRIFSTDTVLLNAGAVAGRKLNVRYKLDLYGQLLTAWILTDAEVKAWKAAH
ncbi:hypothetical protein [Cupriavidus sp. H18C2]|uniref:hypothetical protein n=1 Tax=Cupriavidus sp. H18C2 TaxID=3241602 RepID=UPI003BF79907